MMVIKISILKKYFIEITCFFYLYKHIMYIQVYTLYACINRKGVDLMERTMQETMSLPKILYLSRKEFYYIL